jgi:ABC-type glycerol-3-phosphate transport system substrate-binding protein
VQPKTSSRGRLFTAGLVVGIATVVLAVLIVAPGCGPGKQEATTAPAGKPFQDVVVKVACPGGPHGDLVARFVGRFGRAWSARSGARLEVVTYDPVSGPQQGQPADVWIISPAGMPHWAAGNLLQPVPAEIVNSPAFGWKQVVPLYRHILLLWDNRVYGLPLLGETWLTFYRRDLFEDPRHRSGYKAFLAEKKLPDRELGGPQSWEEFADIAEYFNDKKRPGMDHPSRSLPPLPEREDLDRLFYSVAAPFVRRAIKEDEQPRPSDAEVYPFHYDLDGSQARVNSAGFVHALELLWRLQACRPVGKASEPLQAFLDGEAVLCLASPAWISRFQDAQSRVRGRFGFCPVPGSDRFYLPTGEPRTAPKGGNRIPYLGAGGWLGVVPRAAAQPKAAFDLLADLSGPETSRKVVLEPAFGGSGFREDHFAAGPGWNAFDLDTTHTEALRLTVKDTMSAALLNPVVRLRTPDEHTHMQAMVKSVQSALTGSTPARKALDDAAAAWQELDKKKDAAQRRRDYRLSLGLTDTR